MSKDVNDFLAGLLGEQETTEDKSVTQFLEKLAAEKADDKTNEEESMTREDLERMDIKDLMALASQVTEEKTAEGDMDLDKSVEILSSITAAQLETALGTDLEKAASEEEINELNNVSALDYISMVGEGLEKEAEGEIDLENISVADFVEGVASGEIEVDGLEKGAESDEIDLENISVADFITGVASGDIEVDGLEKEAEEGYGELDLSKTSVADFLAGVESGDIVVPELEKEAEDGEIDLNQISVSDFIDGVASGDIEVEDEMEKEAEEQDYWYSTGAQVANGFIDYLNQNEKTAEDNDEIKQALIEIIENGMEKEAFDYKKSLDKLVNFTRKAGGGKQVVGSKGKRQAKSALETYGSHWKNHPFRTGAAHGVAIGGVAGGGYGIKAYSKKKRS